MGDSDSQDSFRANARIDLLGVPCPLNWARAKARLETMRRGESIELVTDDPRAARDIPVAAEGEGYCVLSVRMIGDVCHICIER